MKIKRIRIKAQRFHTSLYLQVAAVSVNQLATIKFIINNHIGEITYRR